MPRRKHPERMKRRTREHVLADLSVNAVERFIYRAGYAVSETSGIDYGLDLVMLTFTPDGQVESGGVWFQVKATDRPTALSDGQHISLAVSVADLKYWKSQTMPVILVVYDGRRDVAYWLYVQQYVREQGVDVDSLGGKSVRVRVPIANRLDEAAVLAFRSFKNRVVGQTEGVDHGR